MSSSQIKLFDIYNKLYKRFGSQNWWPADTDFEVVIGAILTQNTAWSNVEKAIANLKKKRLLSAKKLRALKLVRLAELIRPSGYYNIKTKRIRAFLDCLFSDYNGSLKKMFKSDLSRLRQALLGINGIGPETADSIILYAANRPVFVVDAYTRRIFSRHDIIKPEATYDQIQRFFMDNLPLDRSLFNEYHALIVELGKNICKTKPRCDICPIACFVK